jgi:hypothetical protein
MYLFLGYHVLGFPVMCSANLCYCKYSMSVPSIACYRIVSATGKPVLFLAARQNNSSALLLPAKQKYKPTDLVRGGGGGSQGFNPDQYHTSLGYSTV